MAVLQSGRLYGGSGNFNPKYILTQLVVMQAAFYLIFSLLLFVVFTFVGWPRYVMTMFDHLEYNLTSLRGSVVDLMFLVNGLTMAPVMKVVVERTKKCLDFACSHHFIHVLLCWLLQGFPTCWGYWVTTAIAIVLTTVMAERLCMQEELKEIKLSKESVGASADVVGRSVTTAEELHEMFPQGP
eukprot:GHVS01022233.1.p1 GENE.GHVS01022233.1~~GHVS01022233.1.p1  ORF type:complete len:184 (+),score=15.67 GHVS01022233.1:53-604(+)